MTFLRLLAAAIFFTGCLDRPLTETSPETTNVYVNQLRQTAVTKIDLLFMVDNSTSMADKQEILQSAVPVLVKRLTSPICVNAKGEPTGESSVGGRCTAGRPEFDPVADIHVGIVTSSLGVHGGLDTCTDTSKGKTPNDNAHLLATVRPTGSSADPKLVFDASRSWNNAGFLAWDAEQVDKPVPGTKDPEAFKATFQDMITASGELGCGYEASLESWYRFLVDPEPPAAVTRSTTNPPQTLRGSALVIHPDGSSTCNGCDQELLAQRKAFLRPDSLVAIVMLSDENDCSFRDDGPSWRVASNGDGNGHPWHMPRATSACAANPNDPCCRSCGNGEAKPPDGCAPLTEDAVCKTGATLGDDDDNANLRCYDQKRRFGADFLYPTARYVTALTSPTLTLQSDGKTQVPNPLFSAAAGAPPRAPDSVFLAGIVGVPWQDIADEESLSGAGLKYLSAEELAAKGRWPMLLGSPGTSSTPPTAPSDPFMIESPLPRAGMNPITHDPIQPATATSPTASPINGHEQNVPSLNDLQYACTFPRKTPKTCVAGDQACDCTPDMDSSLTTVTKANSPLCQPPGGGAPTTTQSYAKAYPGTRELQVLKGMSTQGIVASICPKVTDSADSDPNYGYNPAVAAIIERLKSKLQGQCLPRAPRIDPQTHQVQCSVIEARPNATSCDCKAPGRAQPDARLLPAVLRELKADGQCGAPGQAACTSFCECEILQESAGPALDACLKDEAPPAGSPPGYCYIDDPGSPALANCPSNEKRILHFVSPNGQPIPAADAVAVIACMGSPVDVSPAGAP